MARAPRYHVGLTSTDDGLPPPTVVWDRLTGEKTWFRNPAAAREYADRMEKECDSGSRSENHDTK